MTLFLVNVRDLKLYIYDFKFCKLTTLKNKKINFKEKKSQILKI